MPVGAEGQRPARPRRVPWLPLPRAAPRHLGVTGTLSALLPRADGSSPLLLRATAGTEGTRPSGARIEALCIFSSRELSSLLGPGAGQQWALREPLPAPAAMVSCPPPGLIQPAISIFPCVTTEAGGVRGRSLRPDAGWLRSAPCLSSPQARVLCPCSWAPCSPRCRGPSSARQRSPCCSAWAGSSRARSGWCRACSFQGLALTNPSLCFFFANNLKTPVQDAKRLQRGHFLPGKRHEHRLLCSKAAEGLRHEVGSAGS